QRPVQVRRLGGGDPVDEVLFERGQPAGERVGRPRQGEAAPAGGADGAPPAAWGCRPTHIASVDRCGAGTAVTEPVTGPAVSPGGCRTVDPRLPSSRTQTPAWVRHAWCA